MCVLADRGLVYLNHKGEIVAAIPLDEVKEDAELFDSIYVFMNHNDRDLLHARLSFDSFPEITFRGREAGTSHNSLFKTFQAYLILKKNNQTYTEIIMASKNFFEESKHMGWKQLKSRYSISPCISKAISSPNVLEELKKWIRKYGLGEMSFHTQGNNFILTENPTWHHNSDFSNVFVYDLKHKTLSILMEPTDGLKEYLRSETYLEIPK